MITRSPPPNFNLQAIIHTCTFENYQPIATEETLNWQKWQPKCHVLTDTFNKKLVRIKMVHSSLTTVAFHT